MEEQKSTYGIKIYLGNQIPASYLNLVLSKWARSLRKGNAFFKLIDSDSYYEAYDKYIKSILLRPQTIVRFATLSDDPDVVLGFSVSEKRALHYCYVQTDMRRQGIGQALVPFTVETLTHLTTIGMAIWNSKLPDAKFNPFN